MDTKDFFLKPIRRSPKIVKEDIRLVEDRLNSPSLTEKRKKTLERILKDLNVEYSSSWKSTKESQPGK